MAEATLQELMSPSTDPRRDQSEPPGGQETPEYPEFDEPVGEGSDISVVNVVLAFRDECEDIRKDRDDLSARNEDAYFGRQDWSDKIEGQSTEFLPKTSMAVDQVSTFVKRGIAGYGQWFQTELKPKPQTLGLHITDQEVENLIRQRIESNNDDDPRTLAFPTTLADGVKVALLRSMLILKVHGDYETIRVPTAVRSGGEMHLALTERQVWKLRVDLVRPEDFGIDPDGQYVQHYTEKELWQVVEDSQGEHPLYDPDVVKQIEDDYADWDRQYQMSLETNEGPPMATPPFRKKVQLIEHWGILLDEEGNLTHRNIVCTVANDKYLIRRPVANPNWHQQNPFVYGPLLRVPFSTWHKALFDYAVDLNLALNQLFNLIIDGGIATVWNARQVKLSLVENASDFTDGIPAGATFLLKEEAPPGEPVCQVTETGKVPPDALATFNLLDREYQAASLNNDMKMGLLPPRQVKATEMVETSNQASVFFESIIFDIEQNIIRPVLRKIWLTMLQHVQDWTPDDTEGCISPQSLLELQQMSPAERFALFGTGARFKVFGLSSTLARTKEFQKIMALQQVLAQNPLLMAAYTQRFSADKALDQIFRSLNIDPETMEMDDLEKQQQPQRMQQMQQFSQMMNPTGRGLSAQETGESTLPGQINHVGNALTGLGGAPTRR